ncbi:hypothetical protein TL16_g08993 [Triparma laevis f. inornata]|uniref:Peptidyl-prolyl cis-trans isomerase n=1 Tax=Triparma laevis f. inornata TaxID=1714386 RepID=A0A9W7B0G3_9STRA|nr:hypothetical protein TL16_g08993 [Triparma laevis f. inornata]
MSSSTGPPEPLPPDWVVKRTKDDSHFYYYNMATGESTWSKPAPVIDVSAVADLAGAILTAKKPSKKRPKEDEKRKESKRPKKEKKDDGPTPEGKVRVMHILKKHIGSSRPSSWKEKVIKRTIEEAHIELEELRGMILEAGGEMIETFKSLASEESDCSSAKKQVRLGGG